MLIWQNYEMNNKQKERKSKSLIMNGKQYRIKTIQYILKVCIYIL